MNQDEYILLKKKNDELLDKLSSLSIGSDEYKKVRTVQREIEEKIDEYELTMLNYVIEEHLDKDVSSILDIINLLDEYSIGSHICGLNNKIQSDPSLLADSILEKGLISARREGGGVLENVKMYGNKDVKKNLENMLSTFYSRALFFNGGGAVVCIPTTLLSDDGKNMSIGSFPNDLNFIAKDDPRVTSLPINRLVNKIGFIPPQFIVGVVSKDSEGVVKYRKNDKFISLLSQEEQIEFYKTLVTMGLVPDKIRS